MATYAFLDEEDFQASDVTREDVAACSDLNQLIEWYDEFQYLHDKIRSQITSRQFSGIADDAWVWSATSAVAYADIGMKQIKRRMRAFNYDPDPNGGIIHRLNEKLASKNAELAFARPFQEAAKDMLAPEVFQAISERAKADMDRAAEEKRAGAEIRVAA